MVAESVLAKRETSSLFNIGGNVNCCIIFGKIYNPYIFEPSFSAITLVEILLTNN